MKRKKVKKVKEGENGPAAPVERSEGDINLSECREAWAGENLDDETRGLLDEDARK